jgi:hypothetical protein
MLPVTSFRLPASIISATTTYWLPPGNLQVERGSQHLLYCPATGNRQPVTKNYRFKLSLVTLVGVSFPAMIDVELMAMAFIMAAILFISSVSISSSWV